MTPAEEEEIRASVQRANDARSIMTDPPPENQASRHRRLLLEELDRVRSA